jgi:hypothetical protein
LTLLWAGVSNAGPITGKYWFYGVANGEAADENDNLFDALKQYKPWKDIPDAQKRLRDNAGGSMIFDDLKYFHDNVKDGDVFIFYYGGHATNALPDTDNDDPGDDEGIGMPGDVISDDKLASDPAFGSFPKSSASIVIMNTCFAGGFLGGSNDLDRAAIREKKNLMFMGPVAETSLCGAGVRFLSNLISALEAGDANKDKQTHAKEWLAKMREYWNIPAIDQKLAEWDNLDAEHDRTVGNADDDHPAPVAEPATLLLVASGLAAALGRRSTSSFAASAEAPRRR